jgi:hypothetical protein
MDILLLVITIVSLLIAGFFGLAARSMWREERARSAARVAALAAAARDDHPAADFPLEDPSPSPKTPLWSTPVASREPMIVQSTRPRRQAPVFRGQPSQAERAADIGETFLGSAVAAAPSGGRQRGLAMAAVVLFVALIAGAYFTFADNGPGQANPGASASAATTPLELISLRHERKNGALAITGLVRNPSAGSRVDKLDAVAMLFDQQGVLLTSSRAGVDFTQLVPGDESPFVIRVDAPTSVARYRVSFRTDAGVVPHIDRRGQEPIARDLP